MPNDFDMAQFNAQLYNSNPSGIIGKLKDSNGNFKLDDTHLGEANANGVRPVNDAGKAAIMANFNNATPQATTATLDGLHVDQSATGNPTPMPDLPPITYGIKKKLKPQTGVQGGYDTIGDAASNIA